MLSRFIHYVACVGISHIWLSHSSVEGHTDWFYLLASVNNVSKNMGVQMHFDTLLFILLSI